jgi:hypothetical protein
MSTIGGSMGVAAGLIIAAMSVDTVTALIPAECTLASGCGMYDIIRWVLIAILLICIAVGSGVAVRALVNMLPAAKANR